MMHFVTPLGARRPLCAWWALVLVTGCAPRASMSTPAAANASPGAPCSGSALTYVENVRPVLERSCFACHAPGGEAGDEHDFTRFAVLHAQKDAMVANVASQSMPPPGRPQLQDGEVAVLLRWAACGARER